MSGHAEVHAMLIRPIAPPVENQGRKALDSLSFPRKREQEHAGMTNQKSRFS
jgi:hypothetical protein